MGGTFVAVGARVVTGGNICNAGRADVRGYFFLVHANHTYTITRGSQHILAAGVLPPVLPRVPHPTGAVVTPTPTTLPPPHMPSTLLGVLLRLEISVTDTTIEAHVNGVPVASVEDSMYTAGFAAMASGWHRALFTKLRIQAV